MVNNIIENYVFNLTKMLSTIDKKQVEEVVLRILKLKSERKTLYICGNGGSAANAIHISNDFTFGVSPDGNSISVEALSANSSIITCIGNDIGYENIFSHQLKVKGKSGDCLILLSGSGNSQNIVNAIKQAKILDIDTIAILGFDGGKVKSLVNIPIHFEINDMQISEDLQLVVGHLLMRLLYEKLSK